MKVILTADVAKVGRKHEVKDLSDGYARNFLIARGLGIVATPEAIARIELQKKGKQEEEHAKDEALAKAVKALDGASITIKRQADEKGHLFAGLKAEDIAAEIKTQKGITVAPEQIELPKPIKAHGEYTLAIGPEKKQGKVTLVVA